MKKMQTGTLTRDLEIKRDAINEETRTVDLAFSSEEPVERWWGNEVLDHGKKSVRLGRLSNGGPLLMDHSTRDHIGVIEGVSIDADRKGRAVVRFGKSERANEMFNDVLDGVRRHVSVGYRIHKMHLEETDGDEETYRATDWEPYEISLVSVPADTTVGVGRAAGDDDFQTEIEERTMPEEKKPEVTPAPTQERKAETIDVNRAREDIRKDELSRIADIEAIGEAHGETKLAREFVKSGKSLDEFRTALLEKIGARPAPSADIGMTEKEVRRFSIVRAINALANPTDRRAQEDAAFEYEASAAAAEKHGKESRGIMIPDEVLKRDLTVGTATAGGHTVSTDLLAQNFIEMLRNRSVVFPRATQLTGLVGNIAIPRQTGGATAYWVGESSAPTESQPAFDQVPMSPNTVGAFTDISRKLLLQSSLDVEAFVRGDLAKVLGLEIDRVSINGSGAGNEPTGILNTTGIGDVAGGTNGLAPAFSHVVDLETEITQDNADVGSLFYVTNAKVRGKLKQTEKASGTAQFVWNGNEMNGYQALTSNQVPSNLDKGTSTGVCSAIIFGNLADLIVGLWGGLDLMVDPYTASTSGTVRVVALQDIDIAARCAESFAAMQDALAT